MTWFGDGLADDFEEKICEKSLSVRGTGRGVETDMGRWKAKSEARCTSTEDR